MSPQEVKDPLIERRTFHQRSGTQVAELSNCVKERVTLRATIVHEEEMSPYQKQA